MDAGDYGCPFLVWRIACARTQRSKFRFATCRNGCRRLRMPVPRRAHCMRPDGTQQSWFRRLPKWMQAITDARSSYGALHAPVRNAANFVSPHAGTDAGDYGCLFLVGRIACARTERSKVGFAACRNGCRRLRMPVPRMAHCMRPYATQQISFRHMPERMQ